MNSFLRKAKMSLFDEFLSACTQEVTFELRGIPSVPWSDFILNPRRLRGSDFLMRWSQGQWSEERIISAVNETSSFYAIPYGPSGTAPSDDVKAYELYFERLEAAGSIEIKRPDLLLFKKEDQLTIERIIKDSGGIAELPFINEDKLRDIIEKAVIAVECENSLWKAEKMPDFKSQLTPQRRLGGKPGLKKSAVIPTIILKEEDRGRLNSWQNRHQIKIHIWQVFYDRAYGLSLDRAEELIRDNLIEPIKQIFQAPSGPTTTKMLYKFYYIYGYPLGISIEETKLLAAYVEDKNGHILPYVKFEGGKLRLSEEVLEILSSLKV